MKIVFECVYAANDNCTLDRLKELSNTRREVEEFINDGSIIAKAIAREKFGGSSSHLEQGIQKLEKYLPLLENLIHHSGKEWRYQWASRLKIQWSSALSASSLFSCKGHKFFQSNSLLYELTMMRFLYGAMLREQAREVLSKDLVQSTTLFRKAAGIYHSLATKVVSEYEATLITEERPPEATSNVCSVLSLVCLAEAQAVTIRKAEEKGNTESLLAKLHYGIVQMLDEAIIILHRANKDRKDVSTSFLEFVSTCKAFHELKSYKHFADSLKTDSDSQIGNAIGVLQHAQNTIQKNKQGVMAISY
ncbi:uncharacterized protein LOC135149260 [Daucus carota subsp. sativus]|uniref:uncharacterized protein LOC135149260 n=1 Tax=Daucus carota subsp. sativus TaxID=79200 RepID=UPI003083B13A